MNKADRRPDYKALYEEAVKIYSHTKYFSWGTVDETFFSLRVFETCKDLIKTLRPGTKVRKEIVLCAAILHDIGKASLRTNRLFNDNGELPNKNIEWTKHPRLSAAPASKILKRMGHSQSFIEGVSQIIVMHDKQWIPSRFKPLEVQILQDADLLADMGLEGFVRPFTYSGTFKKPIISQIRYLHQECAKPAPLHRFNLPISKKMALEKRRFERKLTAMMYKDIQSELLK